ncbi:hypothetical protein QFC19_003766 [Naganishia cerealis]|uniref:Uncharacterized protein n=1 Tax=Naganishia cerealis TaxID=610337 RepID=A0ACC2W169_9TREE|nr:hypothetical protein QFC19_003766 [Naganishia cerealis]
MAHDCQPYWLRDQDTWTKIDYKAQAKTWMKPLKKGKETGMVEIPASWDVSTFEKYVLLMLERFIEWVNEHDGIEWVPMVEIEKNFRSRTAVPEGARMPKGV